MAMDLHTVIGIRPVKLKPLIIAMAKAFVKEYDTRIFPELPSAILLPITKAMIKEEGLLNVPGTNVYLKAD